MNCRKDLSHVIRILWLKRCGCVMKESESCLCYKCHSNCSTRQVNWYQLSSFLAAYHCHIFINMINRSESHPFDIRLIICLEYGPSSSQCEKEKWIFRWVLLVLYPMRVCVWVSVCEGRLIWAHGNISQMRFPRILPRLNWAIRIHNIHICRDKRIRLWHLKACKMINTLNKRDIPNANE